ncbi:MAG TPA: S41 family peptidase, partial [Candidatus Eisenbacteria bacterium]
MNRRHLLLAAAFAALFALGWWAGRGGARADLYSNLDLFVEILHKVEDNYVDPVDGGKLVDGAIKGMLKGLDPYSQYLDRREYGQLQSVTEGSFGGIGIVVGVRDNYPTVISPIEGTPAWKAGMRSGDIIVTIEGKSSAGLSIEEVADLLRGPKGSPVRLTVHREGEATNQEYTIEREVIHTRSVPYSFMAERGIGYVRLSGFSETSGEEVRRAVETLAAAGAQRLVLDLRLNPGGLLDQAVDVAEQFLPRNALVVYTHGRQRAQDNRYLAREPHPQLQWPVVVLVDNGSASAAEIVAGALQDLDRALLIGRTTFGKGSVQSVFPLNERSAALKLTTALYYTPSGRSIHRAAHDTLGDDEDDSDEEAAPRGDTTTTARPVFHTAAGRIVYGGGGITPDVTVIPDSLPSLASRAETRGLPFRFANRWLNTHPGAAGAEQPPWDDFVAFLRAEKLPFTDAELADERPLLERAVRREVARRRGGDTAAARIALEGDPVFQRALEVLRRARGPRD